MRNLPWKEDDLKGFTVIKFFAPWCRPCKLYAPAFERVAALNPEADFYELDIDQAPAIRENHGVHGVPTTIIFKDGVEVNRLIGVHSTRGVDEFVKGVLRSEDANST